MKVPSPPAQATLEKIAAATKSIVCIGVRPDGSWFANGCGHEVYGSTPDVAAWALGELIVAEMNGRKRRAEQDLREASETLANLGGFIPCA